MSIIQRYALWPGHDAGGTLPPVDVLVAVVGLESVRSADVPPMRQLVVYVPPQWIGDWESGYKLAPAYQHLWSVAPDALRSVPDPPRYAPYRPDELPPAASGPSPLQRRFRPFPREPKSTR